MHNTTPLYEELRSLRGITFASLNIRSIYRKIHEVNLLLNKSKLDLLLLNETWLNHSVGDEELQIDNYTSHRFDRDAGSGKRGGGGLLAYSRNHYNFEHVFDWNVCTPDIEIQWLKLSLPRTRPTYIANIYRPPEGNLENAQSIIENKLIDIYAERPGDIVIMGDYNVDLLSWGNNVVNKYKLFLKTCRLTQLISVPTRVGNHKASLLDHVITNREDYYYQSGTLDLGLSDHSLIFAARKRKKLHRVVQRMSCRNYRNFIPENFRCHIDRTDWSSITHSQDANVAARLFHETFMSVADIHAPIKMINVKESAPAWMSGDYLAHVDERKFLSKCYRKSPTDLNLQLKTESINRTKTLAESLQRSFFQEALQRTLVT